MAMSITASKTEAALYKVHLHLVLPAPGFRANQMPAPQKPILEELFKRDLADIFSGHPAIPNGGIL